MTEEHHILLIEDDGDTRDAMTLVLEGVGYKVESVTNGQEALDQLRAAAPPPCLILLDLMMPVMDGWQFRDEQQRDNSLSTIPVIVVSADGNVDRKAAALGAAGYLH